MIWKAIRQPGERLLSGVEADAERSPREASVEQAFQPPPRLVATSHNVASVPRLSHLIYAKYPVPCSVTSRCSKSMIFHPDRAISVSQLELAAAFRRSHMVALLHHELIAAS